MPDDPINGLAQGPLYWFRDWPNQAVPTFCAGVYTIWHSDGRFVYVGMSGRSIKSESVPGPLPYGLHTRLSSHFSGRRSGDQFCVYVADRLVLSDLTPANIEDISSGRHPMDVPFGPISMQVWDTGLRSSQPDKPPSKLKGRFRKGEWPHGKPFLNPLTSVGNVVDKEVVMVEQLEGSRRPPDHGWKVTDEGEIFMSVDDRPWLRLFVYTMEQALEKMADRSRYRIED